jgi:pyruvate/2-oxoglutarate dehydrogenase complex dihydrolipoamide acyltransferase (E2) component
MSLAEVKVPDIGDLDEVTLFKLLVKPGDTVKAEQSLITAESDKTKTAMEIPSSHAGLVKELKIKLDDKLKQCSVFIVPNVKRASATPARAAALPSDVLAVFP